MPFNPCQRCGACCASYKVLFPSSETDGHPGGTVPVDQTLIFDAMRSIMRGTETRRKRCVALEGCIGHHVQCNIYANRPSTCDKFRAAWEPDGTNPNCNRARAIYGLQPFDDY